MPSVSQDEQKFMGAALARKRAGHPAASDPDMSEEQLSEFASTKRKGLPKKAKGNPHSDGMKRRLYGE